MSKFKKITILSLPITLLIMIFFLIIVVNTLSLKIDSYKFSYYITNPLSIKTIGKIEYIDLKNKVLYMLGFKIKNDANIIISTAKINKLLKKLPKSAFIDKKALLLLHNQPYKGKARLRGDTFYHWFYPQSSWRFKLSKKNLIDGIRKLNFITPKSNILLNNHFSYLLAKEMSLLAPKSKMITFGINGIYNGTKMLVEQIDENFLRRNRRMPNDIYKGDNIASSTILGVKSQIFDTASIWDKASYNNHYNKNNFYPLYSLLDDINQNQYQLYDLHSFSQLATYIDLVGTTHHDNFHNWVLYYDNYYERFYPIVWDSGGFGKLNEKFNLITSPLLSSLYKNYNFLKLKYHNLKDFSINKKNVFLNKVSSEIKHIKQILDDTNVGTVNLNRKYIEPDIVKTRLDIFNKHIQKRIHKIENTFIGKINTNNYKYSIENNSIRLSISGKKLISKIILKLTKKSNIDKISISYLMNKKLFSHDIPFRYKNNILILPIELLSNISIVSDNTKKLRYDIATYNINFDGLDIKDIIDVQFEFLNINHQIISVQKVPYIEQKEFVNVYNIIEKYQDKISEIWSEKKYFSGFNIIKKDVIIKPGTKIILDENTTVKIFGKVSAIGTKEKPIIFEAKDKTKPWNTFVLKDAKANGSTFKHCIFKDGSGDKGDLYEYTAMFSVHNVNNLLVEDCKFYDSHRTDDMVHVIYSNAKFKNTKFIRSLSDALDVDISNVIVDNCEFIDSGNDSIDLMTTKAVVVNTRFTNSADKGISIGEGSSLLAINNYIKGSEIGMQSKDTSKAYIYNTSFIANKKAIDAYHKNWRYSEGGTITLEHCILDKNIVNATVGKKSKVIINNSDIDTTNKFNPKNLRKKKIIISNNKFIKCDLKEPIFENNLNLINQRNRGYHE